MKAPFHHHAAFACCQAMLAGLLLLIPTSQLQAADSAAVTFDIVSDEHVPLTAPQEWQRLLADLGATNVRIHSGNKPDLTIEPKQRGAKSYRVTGFLTSAGALQLSGGTFNSSSRSELKKWIASVQQDGPEGVQQKPVAFGLLPSQFDELLKDLAQLGLADTRGKTALAAVQEMGSRLQTRLEWESGAQRALQEIKLTDDLSSLSLGSALAISLRAGNLVAVPRRDEKGKVLLHIGKGSSTEAWPIGWPAPEGPSKSVPGLLQFVSVEIADTTLAETLEAIQAKLKVDFLYDHFALQQQKIDPAQVKVAVPSKKITYSTLLTRCLAAGKLRYELRVDEREHPFLWISTTKPVK